jgi:hypothetical protein
MTRMVAVDTHEASNSNKHLTRQAVVVTSSLPCPVQVEKILMRHTEATTIMWPCGMQPWLNSSNKVQVSKADRQVLDDDTCALTCDAPVTHP